jgi:hypothetical protein
MMFHASVELNARGCAGLWNIRSSRASAESEIRIAFDQIPFFIACNSAAILGETN